MSSDDSRNKGIGFFLDRPVAVFTVLLTIAVLGFLSYVRIPVQLLPSGFGSQDISVFVPYPNSNPYETLDKITRLVEEEIETIPGVIQVHSESSADNSQIQIEFSGRADMDLAYAEIRDRMERVLPRLPNGADRYFIFRFNMNESAPVVFGGMLFDKESFDDKVNYIAEEVIKKRIESVDGVARMQVHGLLDQTVRILLDEDRCRAAHIDLGELVTRLSKDNFTTPIGKVSEGGSRYLLRVDTKVKSLDEIREIPVTTQLKIKDIAEVKYVQSVQNELSRINGKYSLFATVSRNSDANIVDVCKRISAAMAELEKRSDLEGFKFLKFFDQGQMIQGSLHNLTDAALWGAGLAVLVLFAFLHRGRLTILVALSIPISVLIALIYEYFSGDSFNMCSMMGMTLGIGMLVDDAIVVVENIYRLRQEGLPFREAAVRGAREVSMAVVASTLTSIVVFLPIIFLSEQRNLRIALTSIGVSLSVALLASLLVAFIFIPTIIYHMQGSGRSRGEELMAKVPSLLPRLQGGIQAILGWTLRHRLAAFVIMIVLLATTGTAFEGIQKTGGGGEGGQHFHIGFDLPKNVTLEDASDEVKHYEEYLAKNKPELGFDNTSVEFDRLQGEFTVWYESPVPEEILKKRIGIAKEGLPKRPGTKIRFRTHISGEGGEQNSGMRLVLEGRDPQLLAELGEQVKQRLERVPEFTSVTTALEKGREEVRVTLDRVKTNALSLSPETVTEIIAWGLRGFSLSRYQEQDRELPMIVQFAHGADESLNDLRDLRVANSGGRDVPLAALADFRFEKGYGSIYRRNGKTILTVNADTQERDLGLLAAKSRAALADIPFPPGYGWSENGGLQQWEEDAGEMMLAALLAIVLVFLLMGILFESAILPVSILFTIPFAMLGAFWLLRITGTPLDLVGMIGFLILIGVVVKNGILLVDHINRLRTIEGMERTAAILKGSADRLRPILMTALATIVGLLPLALTKSNPDEGLNYQGLAVGIIGGLFVSTLFTVWVVPLAYTLVEDLRTALGFRVRALLARRALKS